MFCLIIFCKLRVGEIIAEGETGIKLFEYFFHALYGFLCFARLRTNEHIAPIAAPLIVFMQAKDTTKQLLFSNNHVTYDYIKTMGIELVAGRDISPGYGLDSMNYLINEAAAKQIGYKDPVGKELTMWNDKGQIIGLMKDFHHNSLKEPIEPLIIRLLKHNQWGG